jgi:hypothetical protein
VHVRADTKTSIAMAEVRPIDRDYGEQNADGVDLTLLRANLRLTPLERVRKAEKARRDALLLIEYGRRHREKERGGVRESGSK